METKTFAEGEFCWADVGATNLPATRAFYRELFGWSESVSETPMGPYVIAQRNGKTVAALYGAGAQAGAPQWLPYISVRDLGAAMERARALGAKNLTPAHDVGEAGRMCTLDDPGGARFALWQAGKNPGVQEKNAPGALSWMEMRSRDLAAAQPFYAALFGWTMQAQPMGPGFTYVMCALGEQRVAGMYQMGAEYPPALGSAWLPYFGHPDAAAAAGFAAAHGGRVTVPAMEIPGSKNRFAVLVDPGGACFGVYTPA